MTDELKLRRDVDRAARARALVENDILSEAFDELTNAYIAAWRNSGANDTRAREQLYLAINVIGKVRNHLAAVVAGGKLADAELNAFADIA